MRVKTTLSRTRRRPGVPKGLPELLDRIAALRQVLLTTAAPEEFITARESLMRAYSELTGYSLQHFQVPPPRQSADQLLAQMPALEERLVARRLEQYRRELERGGERP